MAPVLQTLWCPQLQELLPVCKSTEAVDTEKQITGLEVKCKINIPRKSIN
jgi:hypothetical protein